MWSRATKDVRPLPRRKPVAAPRPEPLPAAPPRKSGAAAGASADIARPQKTPRQISARSSVFAAGDPKIEARARRGRAAVERAIDLHGLRQDAARRRLERFLTDASADGVRCVLVITGKGARAEGAREDPGELQSPRGVLRARFLDWIEEEPLRAVIARAATAAPRHGGAGAFYLFLKKRR